MVESKILVVMLSLIHYVMIMLLWSIEPKIDRNHLLPTSESKNLVAIMNVSNSEITTVVETNLGSVV